MWSCKSQSVASLSCLIPLPLPILKRIHNHRNDHKLYLIQVLTNVITCAKAYSTAKAYSSTGKGVYPGAVPTTWLREQSRYICSSPVANYHSVSHFKKCPSVAFCSQTQSHDIKVVPCSTIPHQATLPCLQDICSLRHPTIGFVPSKARPAFARALSSVLKEIVAENSVDAWIKLLMLPKCVLPTSKPGGGGSS